MLTRALKSANRHDAFDGTTCVTCDDGPSTESSSGGVSGNKDSYIRDYVTKGAYVIGRHSVAGRHSLFGRNRVCLQPNPNFLASPGNSDMPQYLKIASFL